MVFAGAMQTVTLIESPMGLRYARAPFRRHAQPPHSHLDPCRAARSTPHRPLLDRRVKPGRLVAALYRGARSYGFYVATQKLILRIRPCVPTGQPKCSLANATAQ